MKHLSSPVILLLAVLSSVALAQVTFQRTYGGDNYDRGHSVAHTADGGYIVAGRTSSFGAGGSDAWLIKTDSPGDTLWTRTFGWTSADEAYSVVQTDDGGYIVAGYTVSVAGSRDAWLTRADATGDTLWTRTFGGTDNDYGRSVAQTRDGGYIVAGYTYSFGAGHFDAWLIKTDGSGDTLWTQTYGGANQDFGYSAAQTRDGGYIVAGCTESYGPGYVAALLVKTDASGDTLWTRTYGGANQDRGYSVVQTADSGFLVAGCTYSFGAGSDDAWLIKTNASGDTLWTRTYGGANSDFGYSVVQTADSGYILAGSTGSFGAGSDDAWLIKTNASGDTLWTRTYGGMNCDGAQSVAQTADGGYIIGGLTYSFGAGDIDVWLIKTDSLGQVGIAEPKPPTPVTPAGASLLPRARLLSELRQNPNLALFDASGRQVLDPSAITPGILFLRSAATTRRVLVVE